MNIFWIFSISIATAAKVGNIRQRSFSKHHHSKHNRKERAEAVLDSVSDKKAFDQLTWWLTQYNNMQGKLSKSFDRKTYNRYFKKYVSTMQQKHKF